MVFKRRDPRHPIQVATELVYPKGGWTRAFLYVRHRVRRLPDSPERIARGIWAGVFTSFTPFYGLHFLVAFIVARLLRGNVIAALSGTFFGNPLTYVPIGVISLKTGHFLLGDDLSADEVSFGGKFLEAWRDLKHNFIALFTDDHADWSGLSQFYDDIFFPYMVGGLIPGAIAGSIAYYLSVPIIRAYQHRRKARIKAKFEEIKKLAQAEADAPEKLG